MSYGYSQRIVEANKSASKTLLGVALGRMCIKLDVPVAEVAATIGVSRETVYNWFTGETYPHSALHVAICDYMTHLSERE